MKTGSVLKLSWLRPTKDISSLAFRSHWCQSAYSGKIATAKQHLLTLFSLPSCKPTFSRVSQKLSLQQNLKF